VELRVADQLVASRLSREHRKQNFAGRKEKSLKGKVNLIAWPLAGLESQCPSAEEEEISTACYSFAVEAIDRMLGDKPGALAKVTAKLKGGRSPDTDKICAAITEVTGRDAKSILLDYVPDYVRAGLKSGEPESLRKDALQKLHARDYAGGAKLLSRLLEMTPSNVNARLDLAWAMRKSGAPRPESERMITIAVNVLQCSEVGRFELCASDADSKYVVGRALQVAGDKQKAKVRFDEVLRLDPSHADAQSALKELEGESPK
jgi:tetratricopeptide (TPR) repeat protein